MRFIIENIIQIISPTILSIVLAAVDSSIDKANHKELIKNLGKEHIVMRLPKAYIWIGCLSFAFPATCLVLMFCFPNDTVTPWVICGFGLLALTGIGFVLGRILWRIEIFRYKNYILLRTRTLKPRELQYRDCKSFHLGTNYLKLKTNIGTFYIDCSATNFEILVEMLTQNRVKQVP